MATQEKKDLRSTTRFVLEASKEIVIDRLFLTKTLMHAIRNNLPVELSGAQIDPISKTRDDIEEGHTVETIAAASIRPARRPYPVILALVVLTTLVVGGLVAYSFTQRAERSAAASEASSRVLHAVNVDLNRPEVMLEVAQKRLVAGDPAGAADALEPLWKRRVRTSVTAPLLAQSHLEAQNWEAARSVARAVLAEDPVDRGMLSTFNTALANDPAFAMQWRDLDLDGFSSVEVTGREGVLKLERDGKVFEIVVATEERPDDWEDPIAAYRLCLALDCEFGMPRALPVRVDLQSLAVHAALDGDDSTFVAGEDGMVRGSLVEASATEYARFPIERTRTWRALLSGRSSLDKRPVTQVLARWEEREEKLWPAIAEEAADMSGVSLARQLSSMLVFDYMANNWNRFHWRDHGKAMRIKDGKLWALGHAGAFKTRSSKRVSGRFGWTDRLDGTEIAAATSIDLDKLGSRIFVSGSQESLDKIQTMKRQQKSLSKRVDRLEKKWGSAAVFALQ